MKKIDELRRNGYSSVRPVARFDAQPAVSPTAVLPPYRADLKAGYVAVADTVPDPEQPRKSFADDALHELAAALADPAIGQLQPILVRVDPVNKCWIIIDGERRWRAAPLAGMTHLRAIFICQEMTRDQVRAQQLSCSLHRVDLSPEEKARAFRMEMDARHWTQAQLAEHLHIGQASVSRILSVLKLSEEERATIRETSAPATLAFETARVADPAARRDILQLAAAGQVGEALATATAARKQRTKTTAAPPKTLTFTATNGLRVTVGGAAAISDAAAMEALEDVVRQVRARMVQSEAA